MSCSASESREISLAYGLRSNFNISNTTSNSISTSDRDRTDLILQLLRLDSLNCEEKDSLISLIQNHSNRFHFPFDELERINAAQYFIPIINEIPIHTKQYRFPSTQKKYEINLTEATRELWISNYSNIEATFEDIMQKTRQIKERKFREQWITMYNATVAGLEY